MYTKMRILTLLKAGLNFLIPIFQKEVKVRRKKIGEKGFTLVELAIVLVIIGIIIGAVIKGQDLIDNARAKKLNSTIQSWNMLTWAFMDRKGRFPGDATNVNGLIGDVALEQTAAASAIGEIAAAGAFTNVPDNPVILGSYQFYVYIGYDTPSGTSKDCMVICKTVNCAATAFTGEELRFIEAIDTTVDGVSNAGFGQFRGATAVTLAPTPPTQINNRYASAVTAVTAVNETAAGATTAWATTQNAAVWLFDKPY